MSGWVKRSGPYRGSYSEGVDSVEWPLRNRKHDIVVFENQGGNLGNTCFHSLATVVPTTHLVSLLVYTRDGKVVDF